MTRAVVTGASGFIGRGVVQALHDAGVDVVAVTRTQPDAALFPAQVETCAIGDLAAGAEALGQACEGADVIVHLADNPERTEQGSGSLALARSVSDAATAARVPRIVFASSIYAGREGARMSDYGAGKRAAEQLFTELPGAHSVKLRLPPVYGPGGKGGFALVTALVHRGWPLPLGLAKARRAYLSRSNLAALIVRLAMLDDERFVALSDKVWEPHDVTVSTADLARAIGAATGTHLRLWPVPPAPLFLAASLVGKRAGAEAVFSPLVCADTAELRRLAGWEPSTDLVANLAYLRP